MLPAKSNLPTLLGNYYFTYLVVNRNRTVDNVCFYLSENFNYTLNTVLHLYTTLNSQKITTDVFESLSFYSK